MAYPLLHRALAGWDRRALRERGASVSAGSIMQAFVVRFRAVLRIRGHSSR